MSRGGQAAGGRRFGRADLGIDPVAACPVLLGSVLEATSADGTVAARVVEVEAYCGTDDPASHAYRGRTARNAVMWGPAGHLYVYFVYGLHFCANVVCAGDGQAGAVLLRAAEITDGQDLATARRPAARSARDLARGPARLTAALGLTREHNGVDLTAADSPVRLRAGERPEPGEVEHGPRVGVAAAGDVPWRSWLSSSRAVSRYRPGGRRGANGPDSVTTSRLEG
ncbi:DNA-3-methyladenine glycosylase [Haloechinothrix alba]|uniref:Putative 3-methyladenine DNA glycosylase n=1 Tax=Haloechinothrix alba TaxID=664784 RepID=A0A238ZNM1_9PSEU|nr:DNA-3-methyladenine glycosylase [Haloechinothrix alba]SNR84769.1 DNA-3-methyladenine glycosylase [Haloechinothrix alba]